MYEMASQPFWITNKQSIINDLTHWIHHCGHTSTYCVGFLKIYTIHDTRLAASYSFWTYVASIPLTVSLLIYFTTDPGTMKGLYRRYIVCKLNSWMFGIGNVFRCGTAGFVWIKYHLQDHVSPLNVIWFWPLIFTFTVDQLVTCRLLNSMAKKNLKQYKAMQTDVLSRTSVNKS